MQTDDSIAEKNAGTRHRGAQLAAIAAIALAITNVLTPTIYSSGSNPTTLLFLRAIFTTLAIGTILVFTGRLKLLSIRQEINCAISGMLFMFAGVGLLGSFAITPVSRAVLILYLFPILTLLIDALVRRTMPKLKTMLLLIVALAGLALVLGVDQGFEVSRGEALALMAAFGAATTFVWNNHKLASVDPEQITFRMFFISFLMFGIWLMINGGMQIPESSPGQIRFIAILFVFAVAFLSMFRASQMAGSVRASMIMNLEPVVTIFFSVVFLSETLSIMQFAGAILVLGAVALSQSVSPKFRKL